MTKITLENEDGDYVTSAELEDPLPELIIWNFRFFISDTFETVSDGQTYTETIPFELPYEMPAARPAGPDDNGEDEDEPA